MQSTHTSAPGASAATDPLPQVQVPLEVVLDLATSLLRAREDRIVELQRRVAMLESLLRAAADSMVPSGTVWQ
jgi:hypothetical protein